MENCRNCNGTGKVDCTAMDNGFLDTRPSMLWDGEETCRKCNGRGLIEAAETKEKGRC